MGVEIRIASSRVPVVKGGCQHSPRWHLSAAGSAGASVKGTLLEQRHRVVEGGTVRVRDGLLNGGIRECPQHAGGLRDSEGEVEAGDGAGTRSGAFPTADLRDLVRPLMLVQMRRQGVNEDSDPISKSTELRVRATEGKAGEGVAALAEQPCHLLFRDR